MSYIHPIVEKEWSPPLRGFHFPITALLEITRRCFSSCTGCGNSRLNQGRDLTLEAFDHIIAKLIPYVKEIRLIGGEPTLHLNLLDFCQRLDSKRIDFSIITNGISSHWIQLSSSLKGLSTFKGFLISLHGHNATIHEKFSGLPNSFDKVIYSIESASNMGIWVSTSTVITKWNIHNLGEIISLSKSIGAKYSVFNRFLGPYYEGRPDDLEFRNSLQEISELIEKGNHIRFGNCVPLCSLKKDSNTVEICPAGRMSLAIGPNGDVRPCLHTNICTGNLLVQDLETIWKSKQFENWRHFIPPSCGICKNKVFCEAGCKVANSWSPIIDPLISKKDMTSNDSFDKKTKIRIDSMRIPIICGKIQRNGPQWVVYNNGQIVKLSNFDLDVIKSIESRLSIHDLKLKFGHPSIELVVDLWRRGMVIWA